MRLAVAPSWPTSRPAERGLMVPSDLESSGVHLVSRGKLLPENHICSDPRASQAARSIITAAASRTAVGTTSLAKSL